MNIRLNYIYTGQAPTAETFWSTSDGRDIDSGIQQADTIIRARTGQGYNVNMIATPFSSASSIENWKELGIKAPGVLVFSLADQNLVVGVLKNITSSNVRDILVKIVLLTAATESSTMNTDGGQLESERLDFPDSFFPFGIFKGPGWEGWKWKKYLWLAAAAIAGIETARSRTVTARVVWASGTAFSVWKFVAKEK